jgi:hypothetical protein
MGYLRQSIAAVLAFTSIVLLIPFVDAQTGTITTATWQAGGATGPIAAGPAAAVLNDGRILIAGYTPTTGRASATVAIYNPATGAWTTAGNLLQSRTGHTATTLTDGRVLIAGGKIASPGGALSLTGSLELFNPSTGTSTAVIGTGLAIPRSGHAAARLPDGRVLFVGGTNNLGTLDIAEIYTPGIDPAPGTVVQATGQMSAQRSNPSATLLPDGRVLVAGGRNNTGTDLTTAEIFDPASQAFTAVAPMGAARSSHAAALLSFNNNVLVFGGSSNGTSLAAAELYDPGTNTWTTTASMAAPRVGGFAAARPDGGAIAMGGGPTIAEFYRFVSISSGSSGTTGGTGGTPTSGGTTPPATDPASSGTLLDFPHTGHPSRPDGGTFGYPFIELTDSVLDHVHENELFGATTWDSATQTLAMKLYPQWITFASAPQWFQAGSLAQSTDENLAISPCNQPGTYTDINHNGIQDSEDTNGNHVLDEGEDVNGNGILDIEPPIECGRFEIHAQVDSQGHLVGAGTATDVLMRGHIITEHFDTSLTEDVNHNGALDLGEDVNGNGILDLGRFVTDVNLNGTLLTGRIVAFGFQNPSTDAVLLSFCPFGSSKGTDGLCHAADGSTSQPMCQAGFTPGADGTCHSPAARFNFRVVVTGGLLVDPTRPEWCVSGSCFIRNPLDRFDLNSDLGIDIKAANISGSFAGAAISGYAAGTAGPIPRVAGLSPTTTTLTFDQPVPYTYSGAPFSASAVATASDGLHVLVPVVYTGDCTHVTAAGCTATATFHGDTTHEGSVASQTITITPRPITLKADDVTRIYGETTPAFSYSVAAGTAIAGDVFGTPVFTPAASNVGSHALALSGLSNPDYAITFAPGTFTVTPRELDVTALGTDKIYDGTTSATVTLGDNRMPTDVFTTSYASASFADKRVGTEKTVHVSGISISGPDQANYFVNTTFDTTADITARALTITATGVDKVYDGTTAATVTLADNRIAGDVFTAAYSSAAFADKNVGTGKPVTIAGIGISGTDALNYVPEHLPGSTTANITARPLTVTAAGVDKVYDGATTATVTLSDDHVAGDVVTTAYTSAAFANKSVGTGKAVTITGISVNGSDAGNYGPYHLPAATTANITARSLTVTATGVNKIYDGTTAATVTLGNDRIAGDAVTTSYASAAFADKNVGTAKVVTISGISISGTDATNYAADHLPTTTTASITSRSLTVTATGRDKVYDGTTGATVTLSDNRVPGDLFTDGYTAAAFADKNVGTGKAVTIAGIGITGTDAGNYVLEHLPGSTTANITARSLTVTATGVNKTYDRTTAATVTLGDDRVAGDVFTTAYASAAFADKNVGSSKTVTITGISVSGTDAGNYTADHLPASTTANITARSLTVTATGVNKVYDGNTTAKVNVSDDHLTGDAVTTGYASAAFADKNVGTAKTVTITGISISGADAGNYSPVHVPTETRADITARTLSVTASGVNKVYDGAVAATVSLSDDRVAGDVFTDAYAAAAFADKNAGTGKTVNVTGITITGTDAGNYTFNATASTIASITARSLTVTATGVNKVYDGSTAATVSLSDNRVTGDLFTDAYTTAAFASKTVGTGKTVNVTGIAITGTDAGNYTFNTTASATANITARALTVNATGVNKVYDGTTAATVSLNDNRVAGDLFTDAYTAAAFTTKTVGTGKTVNVTGITITGTDAGNYTFNATASATADITARSLTVSATGVSKTYDGTTQATVTLSDNRAGGDVLTSAYTSAVFADENVGTGKTVTVTGISISGTDAGNYTFNATASATANIAARSLTVTAIGVNKVYDGSTAATVSLNDNRVAGDVFTDAYTLATFASKSVGTGKTVTVTGISISGADAGNYTFNATASATANITARSLTVTATGVNKVYDGTTAATVSLNDNRVAGDVFTDAYASAAFADENVGTGKPVAVNGVSISGPDAGNYLANATASTTADITKRSLTVSATGVNKTYDGTTATTVSLSDNRVSGDVLTDAYASATFANKNAGTGKAVTVNGISISGADAGNYTVNMTASTTADITARLLKVTASGINKIYDGTTNATVTLSDDRIGGDVLTASYTAATFAGKNVGTGKTVSVTGIALAGTDAGNYAPNATASTTADITARSLTITATGVNKVYDGTTSATVSLGDNRVSGDSLTSVYTSATFADRNAGTAKTVTVSGISISGADAANYTANTSASASADITPRAASVAPDAASKTYGTSDPAPLTGTLTGFLSTDGVSATYSRDAGDTVAGSPYAISATLSPAAVLGNYAITYKTASFTITKATASVSATGGSFTYDGTVHAGGGSATGGRGESLPVTLSYAGTGTTVYGPTAAAPVNAGTYSVIASAAGDSNNNGASSTPASLTIGKATATVTLSNLTKSYTGTAQSPTATTTPAGLAVDWTGAPQTNAGSYPVTATINDPNYQGSASGTFVINPAAATATSTLAVSNLQPQYSDQDTFTVTVTSSAPGQPAAGVNFFVGTQQVGSPTPITVPLVVVGDPATSTTYKAVWTGQLLEPTPTGQMKPGMHIVTAAFVNPNFTITAPAGKSVNIVREDARLAGLDRTSYSLGGSATGVVPLTVTVKDISAMVGDAAFDAFAGDIRNAQVQFIDRATNAVIGTATVNTLVGPGTTTGTATLNWSVNLGTATSKSFTIGFAVLNYYTRSNQAADNVVITVSK